MGNLGVGIQPKISFVQFSTMMNWSVRYLIENNFDYNIKYTLFSIGDFLQRNRNTITIEDDTLYSRVTIRLYNKGVQKRDEAYGKEIGTKKQYLIKPGQFILSKIDARNGAFGIVPESLDGAITTADFLSYDIDDNKINPYFLKLLTTTKQFLAYCQGASSGTTGRQRINEQSFLNAKIPLPSLEVQNKIAEAYNQKIQLAEKQEQQAKQLEQDIEGYLYCVLGIKQRIEKENKRGLQFTDFKGLRRWGVGFMLNNFSPLILLESTKFKNISLYEICDINPQTKIQDVTEMSFVPMKYISDNYGEITNKDSINIQKIKGYTKFQEQDLVWAKITPCMQNGKSAVAKKLLNGFACGSTEYHVIRRKNNDININYIHMILRMKIVLSSAMKHFTGSAGQQRVPEMFLEELKIPFPPLSTQNEIADTIEEMKLKIKTLHEQAVENRRLAIEVFEKEIFQ